jgi:hypothetical protein
MAGIYLPASIRRTGAARVRTHVDSIMIGLRNAPGAVRGLLRGARAFFHDLAALLGLGPISIPMPGAPVMCPAPSRAADMSRRGARRSPASVVFGRTDY